MNKIYIDKAACLCSHNMAATTDVHTCKNCGRVWKVVVRGEWALLISKPRRMV